MSQITVVLPNARRQNHKVSPNNTILEVIELVCEKAGLDPEEYDLKHHRNILDSTTTVRFSSIPQNAQLELVEAKTKRKQSKVVLCVQLENSERFQGECFPTDTLWEVLMKIVPEQILGYSNPVIIYMRREIIGSENLKTTNLRSIGLSGGRAVVRLLDKRLEELRTQANVSGLLQRPPIKEKDEIARSPLEANITIKNNEELGVLKKNEAVEKLENNKVSAESESTARFGVGVQDSTNLPFAENVCLNTAADTNLVEDSDEIMNCKRARTKSPENLKNIQVEKVVLLGDRNAVVYNLDTIQSATIEELPDDFYELTLADAKSLAAAARRAVQEIEESPMLTSAQRKLDEDGLILQKLSSHKSCVIRVKFPDRTVLQGVFKPLETFGEVVSFVTSYLEQPNLPFCLYMTPPKNVVNPETRLVEADCVPGANLYYGPLTPEISKSFLKSEVLQKFSSFSAVTNAAHDIRVCGENGKSELTSVQPHTSLNNPKPGPSRLVAADNAKSDGNNLKKDVPKWFKIGK